MIWCQKISFEEPNISTIVTVQNMYKKHDFTAVNSSTAKLQKKTKKNKLFSILHNIFFISAVFISMFSLFLRINFKFRNKIKTLKYWWPYRWFKTIAQWYHQWNESNHKWNKRKHSAWNLNWLWDCSYGGELAWLGGQARGISPSLRNCYKNIMRSYDKWASLPRWDLAWFCQDLT